jgi:polysaccharide biosynthesis transport protein
VVRLVGILRIHWRVVLGFVVIAVIVGALITAFLPRRYTSNVSLYVSAQGIDSAASAYQGGLLSVDRIKSYTELIQSERLASEVVNQLSLPVSAAELASRISASSVEDTVIIDASYSDSDPALAQKVGNQLSNDFVSLVAELEQPPGGGRPAVVARIVQPASLPTDPSSPSWPVNLIVAFLTGLAGGVAYVFVSSQLDQRLRDETTLSNVASAPSLGAIPESDDLAADKIEFDASPFSEAAESIRGVRTALTFLSIDSPGGRVFVISSSAPEEGKSTISANLGVALAQAGYRTLLIEGDLRQPKLAAKFGLDSSVGLTAVLSGAVAFNQALQVLRPNLVLLASGRRPPNPSEMLGSRQMERLVEECRSKFDYVLIDTPPVLAVSDATVVSRQADGMIFIARYGRATERQVEQGVGKLRVGDIPVAGTVLSVAPKSAGGSERYYGRYWDRATGDKDADTTHAGVSLKEKALGSPSPAPRG